MTGSLWKSTKYAGSPAVTQIKSKMATKKIIEVSETSIVDLKAELFRKEQQFRQESGVNKVVKSERSTTKKPPIWSKQTKTTPKAHSKTQNVQDNFDQSEEEKALQKSRQMLQAKAALYDKMATGEIEDNDDEDGDGGRFLVDFHKKSYNEIIKSKEDDEDSEDNRPPTPPPTCPEEEWVDYVDSLGRSRRCLRKDLQELEKMDKDIKPPRSPSPPTLLSEDMRREIMRKKWEKEEEEAMSRPVGPVHYQNVQYDEVRDLGVGYYQFSKVEEERQKQMETLNKLREETKEQRSRIERVKDKRKAALEARLAKIRARKKIKTGETGEENESKTTDGVNVEEKNEIVEEEPAVSNVVSNKEEAAEKSDEEAERSLEAGKRQIPEWARHKIKQPNIVKSYFNQRREERPDEFAPPCFYYDSATTDVSNTRSKKTTKRYDEDKQTEPTPHYFDSNPQEGKEANSSANQDSFPTNQQWTAPPYYPPHPPPVGNMIPPIPPPPVDYSRPPPGFQPYQNYLPFPPFNYGSMPPPYPLPPWQPLPRQLNPSQWQDATNNAAQQCQFPPSPWQPLPKQPLPGQPSQERTNISTENVSPQCQATVDPVSSREDPKPVIAASIQDDSNCTLVNNQSTTNTTEKSTTSNTNPSAEAVADFLSSMRHKSS